MKGAIKLSSCEVSELAGADANASSWQIQKEAELRQEHHLSYFRVRCFENTSDHSLQGLIDLWASSP